jgi:glutathione S-transferase
MGEAPVLVHGRRSSASQRVPVLSGGDAAANSAPQSEDEAAQALRWIIFDNQKVNSFLGPSLPRSLPIRPGDRRCSPSPGASTAIWRSSTSAVTRSFVRERPTIADVSLRRVSLLPGREFGFDIASTIRRSGNGSSA